MNKRIIGIIIVTLIFISTLVYMNFFTNDFRISNFKSIDEVEVLNEYKDSRTKACYGNKVKCNSVKPEIEGVIDTKKLGEYKVKYQYNNEYIYRDVIVIDKEVPVIKLIGGDTIYILLNGKYQEAGYVVSDNYDTDLDKQVKISGKLLLGYL